jgi:hypothetical protein
LLVWLSGNPVTVRVLPCLHGYGPEFVANRMEKLTLDTDFLKPVWLFSFAVLAAEDRERDFGDDVAPPLQEGDFIGRAVATKTTASDENNDVADRPDAIKRYMRFGRRFQQQNDKQLSNNKRYMRFGKRTQSDAIHDGNDSDDVAASLLRLSADGGDRALFGEPIRDADANGDAAAASKRYMRFGRR